MVTHVIVRFVAGQFVMDEVGGARAQYLARLDRAVHRVDWTLLWYALMGTHVHLVFIAGEHPLDSWARPLHSGWANWINSAGRRRGGRHRGPVLADRPRTLLVSNGGAMPLGAYLHNNPVRASVVASPEESSWTSHRCYLGLEAPIPSLDVARGLSFYGCTPSRDGRTRFHEYVCDRRGEPRNPELSGATTEHARCRIREVHGSTAEIATPVITGDAAARFPIQMPTDPLRSTSFSGTATEFLQRAAVTLGVEVDALRGPGRSRQRARLREAVVVAWRILGRRACEISTALQVSHPAASNMLGRANEETLRSAGELLSDLAHERAG